MTKEKELIFDYNPIIREIEDAEIFLEKLYLFAYKNNIGEIRLTTNDKVLVEHNKRNIIVSETELNRDVIDFIAEIICKGKNGLAELYSGIAQNRSVDYRDTETGVRVRFRVNIIKVYHLEEFGFSITIRKIDHEPPSLETIGMSVDDEIYKNFFKMQGMSLITGPTGSGKSTTLASMKQHYALNNSVIINSYEEPIEYIYDKVNEESKNSRIIQSAVPNDIESFDVALEESLRRKPDFITIGELRDPATITAAINVGLTGHLVMSTTHTNGVPATLRRLISIFPSEERDSRQVDLIEQMNIIVAQRLLRTTDGKKIAIREHLVFTEEVKNRLQQVEPLKINLEVRKIMNEKGNGLLLEARNLFKSGIIEEKEYKQIESIFGEEYKKSKQ
tara:strand:- start:25300 stop:26469 length:1170 start_codon:yes stop_codon:yes gene_type:complete